MKTKYIDDIMYCTDSDDTSILYCANGFYVSNEGTKMCPNYHVWIPWITHYICDSAYKELDLAIARCNYLDKNSTIIR